MDYLKHYNLLIHKRQVLDPIEKIPNKPGFVETQHIIPRCCHGKDIAQNKVNLTAREHFLAHWLLAKIYIGTPFENPINQAFQFMCNSKLDIKTGKNLGVRCTSKTYQLARENAAKAHKGMKHTDEAKRRIGLAASVRKHIIVDGVLCTKPQTEETKKHISEGLIRFHNSPKQLKIREEKKLKYEANKKLKSDMLAKKEAKRIQDAIKLCSMPFTPTVKFNENRKEYVRQYMARKRAYNLLAKRGIIITT